MQSASISNHFGVGAAMGLALVMLASCSGPDSGSDIGADEAQGPIQIERMGSFSAGGKVIGEVGDASLHCDHGVVDFVIPVDARQNAIFMWHSSSAAVWQQRWDGGEGYQSIFLRAGYPVYLWDGPRVGRANWGCEEYDFLPSVGTDETNFYGWRFGTEEGEWFDNAQFPKGDAAAFDQAMSARYAEFDMPENLQLEAAAAAKAIDRIGPTVVVTNSAGGVRAMVAATQSDNVKAIVAYETPAFVFPEGEGPEGPTGAIDSVRVPLDQFMALTRIPIQIIWGDNIKGTFWEPDVGLSQQFAEIVNAHGGNAEVLILPSIGINGNTHIAPADLNNVEVAAQLKLFLEKNQLDAR